MEFSFEYYDWLQKLNQEPGLMGFVSSFGMLGVFFVMLIIIWPLKKTGLNGKIVTSIWADITAIIFINLFIGFLVMMSLVFVVDNEFAGIRLFLIWLVLLVTITVFYITNKHTLSKFTGEMDIKKKKG